MSNCFQSSTNVIVFNISLNIFSKAWLIIFTVDELSGFINIKVACQYVVVILANKFCLNNFKYKW